MEQTALRIQNLNVVYMPYTGMRVRNLLSGNGKKVKPIHAVRDLTLSVDKGEIVGIVGRNGSGKTTLLRAIAGIFSPDSGTIELYGNRVSLMSLGIGFDPELTGRENIVLSGIMMGFKRSIISELMTEIIAFSEIGEFIDYPVRTYSRGMYSRLAFSITAFLETDIMLIDEALSVGDAQFNEKSEKKMKELIMDRKHTALIVSHDEGMLRSICGRAVWIDKGRVMLSGNVETVISAYREHIDGEEHGRVI